MVFYGVGNHGGGPTRANIDSIHRLNASGAVGHLTLSSPVAYFDEVRASGQEYPVWRDDLQHHASGCYAAHSSIKKWMRQAEHAVLLAEKWASVTAAAGVTPYPLGELTQAWKQVLFNEFHDILPGTSIEPAYENARDQLGEARAIAARVLNRSLQTVARDVDIPVTEETQPVLVFNPHAWPVRTTVEIEYELFPQPVRIVDHTGVAVDVQVTRPLATVANQRRRRLAFNIALPPLGYRLYSIQPTDTSSHATPTSSQRGDEHSLENEHLRIEVDPDNGGLCSLVDKASGHELLAGRQRPHVVVADDRTDTWGHRVVSYAGEGVPFRCQSARLVEQGAVRSILRIESAFGSSRLVEEIILARDTAHVEVRATLDWHERLKLAKLRFPTSLADPTATYEIPYGHLQRPTDGAEEPGQSWVDLTGTLPGGSRAGLTVINDAKAAYDVLGSEIGITIVRSPAYAWHDPRELEPDGIFSYQDQGLQTFRYLLVPHRGDWREAGIVRAAAEVNQPPTVMAESFHPGTRPPSDSFDSVSSGSVVLTAIKRAEDHSDQFVIRAYESAGRPEHARLELPFFDRTIEADFGAHEIKTFLVPIPTTQPVHEVNLLEYVN